MTMPETYNKTMRGWCFLWLILFIFTCAHTGVMMFYHIPLDYNEGWNAQLAAWSIGGEHGLYSSASGFVFNNYPPLSFLLIGGLVRAGCDAILAGRIVSFLSVLASGWFILRIIQKMTASYIAGLAGALVFLLTANTAFYVYVGLDDPQWLAQALMLGGLAVLLGQKDDKPGPGRLFFSVLLVVLGGFTKHNLIALPLAIFIWLLFADKRQACLWAGMGVSLLLAGFAACYMAYGTAFFTDLFLHQRVIRLSRVFHGVRELPLMGGMLAVGCWAFYRQRKAISHDDPAWLIMLFFIFAVFFGELESLGQGVDYNCMFDALVAGAILAGLGLGKLVLPHGTARQVMLACLVMSLPLLVLVPLRAATFYKEIHNISQKNAIWRENILFVRAHNQSLLCTNMALCYWAGGYNAVDRFNLTQAIKKHRTNFPVHDIISQHDFTFIEVEGTPLSYGSGSPVFDGWLAQAGYHPVLTNDHGIVLLGVEKQ